MAITIKHNFVSAKGDTTDATLVQPSQWNATHATSMAPNNLIGRLSAGAGVFEEIPITTLIANALNSADGQSFLAAIGVGGFTTGDLKPTMKTVADPGWILVNAANGVGNGTIGNAVSGATIRANADCSNLFNVLYAYSDANAPLFTSTGTATTRAAQGTAATAFGNGCRVQVGFFAGRALAVAGNPPDLTTNRNLGDHIGAESFTLGIGNIPSITSSNATQAITVQSTQSNIPSQATPNATRGDYLLTNSGGTYTIGSNATWTLSKIDSTGPNNISVSFSNPTPTPIAGYPPTTFVNVMVKL